MKRLIVNADDFGLTRGVNQGIVRCFRDGIVTSATLMANGEAFDDAISAALANPTLGVGVHLVLVGGPAMGRHVELGALTDRRGLLPRTLASLVSKVSCGLVRGRQMEAEMTAQIEAVRKAGIMPTHLDTHKHAHIHPVIMRSLCRVARECGISRVRMPFEGIRGSFQRGTGLLVRRRSFVIAGRMAYPTFRWFAARYKLSAPEHFFGFAATGRLEGNQLRQIIQILPNGTSELVCHPGNSDEDLRNNPTRLKAERELEMAALTDPAIRQEIAARGVHLMSYGELN